MNNIPDVLKKIVARKLEEITTNQQQTPLSILKEQIEQADKPRGFIKSIEYKINHKQPAVIAEIKKASPSKGVIRENFQPAEIAKSYQKSGAACLSVLTDVDFFQGSNDYLKQARAACSLPVLRKEFILDPYQVYEARAINADCILLITACLETEKMQELNDLAHQLGMDVLIEVHNQAELERTLPLNNRLIGINNRNLRTFEVDLQTTIDLLPLIPPEMIVVTESGILKRADIDFIQQHDIYTFLVGEAFMRASEPGEKLNALFY